MIQIGRDTVIKCIDPEVKLLWAIYSTFKRLLYFTCKTVIIAIFTMLLQRLNDLIHMKYLA